MSSAHQHEDPTQPTETDGAAVYDDAEERLITERLQALGYIE